MKMRSSIIWGLSFLAAVLCFTSGAKAIVYSFAMDKEPSDASYPVPQKMLKVGGGWGQPGDLVPNAEGAGLHVDLDGRTWGRFSDTGAVGTDSFIWQNWVGGGTNLGAYTIDMFLTGNEVVTGPVNATWQSMGFREGTAAKNGRGIKIEPDALRFVGANGAVVATATVNLTSWHIIRLAVPGNATCLVYDLGTNPGASVPVGGWPLLATAGLGGSGANVGAQAAQNFNSSSPANTTNSQWDADWIRADDSHALGAYDAILTPEPATVVLLLLGGLPLVRRRRGG